MNINALQIKSLLCRALRLNAACKVICKVSKSLILNELPPLYLLTLHILQNNIYIIRAGGRVRM